MKCREVMTANPSVCRPDEVITRVAQLMQTEDVGPVLVVFSNADNRLAGIVTDRDLTVKVLATGRNPQTTHVRDVMTSNVLTCHPDDDIESVMEVMGANQVRRIPVVDEKGVLLGIISQADVARLTNESRVGELVEEISEPQGRGWARQAEAWDQRSSIRYVEPEPELSAEPVSNGVNNFAPVLAGLGLGAGLMYLLDNDSGRRRRAFLRNRAGRLYEHSETFAQKAARDFSNRASGVASSARSMWRQEETADDKVLARVRSQLGRVVSHPHAIQVTVENGHTVLAGPILARESGPLIRAIEDVPGVKSLESRLEVHETPERISSLQGGQPRRGSESEFLQKNWTPAIRCTAATVGSGLVLYGLRSKGPLAMMCATLGLGLVGRGLINREVADWADLAALRRTLHV